MKWFFFVCFVAALVGAVLWSALIVYAIVIHQRRWPFLLVFLAVFLYGAWEMLGEYRKARHSG